MNEKSKKPLEFLDYMVRNISFELNEEYHSDETIDIGAMSNANIGEIDEETGRTIVSLKVSLFDGLEEAPFHFEVEVAGLFEVDLEQDEDTIQQLVTLNTVAILLPYARSLVSQITSLAEVATVNLPIVNIQEAYNSRITDKNIKESAN